MARIPRHNIDEPEFSMLVRITLKMINALTFDRTINVCEKTFRFYWTQNRNNRLSHYAFSGDGWVAELGDKPAVVGDVEQFKKDAVFVQIGFSE